MKRKETFEVQQALSLENSFGVLKQETVLLEVTVGINSPDYGWFELYDIESGGEEWYAEGSLQIEGNQITGYDGVFALPEAILTKLKEMGYDTSEVD